MINAQLARRCINLEQQRIIQAQEAITAALEGDQDPRAAIHAAQKTTVDALHQISFWGSMLATSLDESQDKQTSMLAAV